MDSAPDDAAPDSTRRAFLQATGWAAAGFATGFVAGGAATGTVGAIVDAASGGRRSGPGFDHLVVLMFENRSFDNLLGRLYPVGEAPPGQSFNGLTGRHFNLAPPGSPLAGTVYEAQVYAGSTDTIMSQPDPDPGEEYPHVNTQLFGVVDPPENADLAGDRALAPYNAPGPGRSADNRGFVHDYGNNFRRLRGREPSIAELAVAMGGFSPDMLPVLSTLAREFAVYDAWHCAVPSQTFCNRSFFHASTSHGFVTNRGSGGYRKWLDAPAVPTVFNRLEDAGLSWRVYYDEAQLVSLTGVLHAPSLEKYWKSNFRTMNQFYADAAAGTLPVYAFIEPRLVFDHNDMHPPVGVLRESEVAGEEVYDSAISDVRAGEALLHAVYSAIRLGAAAEDTLLLVTFDEHGGTYDHVPPPRSRPPRQDSGPGEMDFAFNRLGCRVPAIAIGPYTRAGTVLNETMHHGAVMSTLSRVHGLEPLTDRDAEARDLLGALNLSEPRAAADWPVTQPQYTPPNPEAVPAPIERYRDHPLSAPGTGLLGLLIARYGQPGEAVPATYGDAFDALKRHGTGLFGTTD